MVETLTRSSPLFAAVPAIPESRGGSGETGRGVRHRRRTPLSAGHPSSSPTIGKLWTVLYQPFTATFLGQTRLWKTSRYRYSQVYRVRRAVLYAAPARWEFKTFPYLRIWTVSNIFEALELALVCRFERLREKYPRCVKIVTRIIRWKVV